MGPCENFDMILLPSPSPALLKMCVLCVPFSRFTTTNSKKEEEGHQQQREAGGKYGESGFEV